MKSREQAGSIFQQAASLSIQALFHLLGVALVFAAMVALSIGGETALSLAQFVAAESTIQEAITFRVLIHLGLAACLWAMLVILYKLAELRFQEKKTPRLVRLPVGTVITETLIALPVLLLLILGMVQLSLNNMTGILTHVAEFQAARTAWVWVPEMQEGVSEGEVRERIRISVALVMTPTAPQERVGISDRAELTQEIMTARFDTGFNLSWPPWGNGSQRLSVERALDSAAALTDRASMKFASAYVNTEVRELIIGEEVGADITFYHFQAVPLVGVIFGSPAGQTALSGQGNRYFQHYEIEARMPAQLYNPGRL